MPAPEAWHGYYWEAWNALRNDRGHAGMSGIETPILFLAIDAYAQRYGIEGEAFDHLRRFVMAIDAAYLDMRSREIQPPPGKPNTERTSA